MRDLCLITIFVMFQGCTVNVNRDRSVGQELIDLQHSWTAGTINPEDYQLRRTQLLSKPGVSIPSNFTN